VIRRGSGCLLDRLSLRRLNPIEPAASAEGTDHDRVGTGRDVALDEERSSVAPRACLRRHEASIPDRRLSPRGRSTYGATRRPLGRHPSGCRLGRISLRRLDPDEAAAGAVGADHDRGRTRLDVALDDQRSSVASSARIRGHRPYIGTIGVLAGPRGRPIRLGPPRDHTRPVTRVTRLSIPASCHGTS
jgi:hypothetical protein